MGIDDFLNKLEAQENKSAEIKLQKQIEKEILEENNRQFLEAFNEYYNSDIIPELDNIKVNLDNKFNLTYPVEPDQVSGTDFYGIRIVPKFQNFTSEVKVMIIVEGKKRSPEEERMISLSGKAYDIQENELDITKKLHLFQGYIQEFKDRSLEEDISLILETIYLNRK